MKRIVLLGRGGSGKSTTAQILGEKLNIPVIELDKHFWQPGLVPLGKKEWAEKQKELTSGDAWVIDGDLGAYDALEARLSLADTVIILNFPFWLCFFRAARRSRERLDFWWWLITWRRVELPKLLRTIEEHAPTANLLIFKTQKELSEFLSRI